MNGKLEDLIEEWERTIANLKETSAVNVAENQFKKLAISTMEKCRDDVKALLNTGGREHE